MQKSRKELIEWIRSLGIEISAIEEIGKGAVICEILSNIHRDFPCNFVRNPAGEHEYLKNMKICQSFFSLKNIKLYFPVERLIKCRMQDNLEVAQWLSKHYYRNSVTKGLGKVSGDMRDGTGADYAGLRARTMSGDMKGCLNGGEARVIPLIGDMTASEDVFGLKDSKVEDPVKVGNSRIQELTKTIAKMEAQMEQMVLNEKRLHEQISQLKNELGGFCDKEVKSLLMTFEKERDFYFKKLFMIERYFLENAELDESVKKDVFEILYEENGE